MPFNTNKSTVMYLAQRTGNLASLSTILHWIVDTVTEEKDLGVHICSHLKQESRAITKTTA